ncbi:hypothetical protein SSP35_03_02190 [Streptomyces sp. NBRC 110611]|uniref:hypothetical protein n=1 Tax=Streptomyces sp. NBRC 110611 TaxID=1621259 RepID=UPI000857C1BC|nr:hypothetical protein [Streptomyces sp. NBRC 110611]GAU66571.1 hypothetical protein SSP35_03_02190 [Streptomyces sp. NBRC 110611]
MGLIGGDGYQLEPEAFEAISKGIKAATAELKELGFDIEAQLGRGFDKLALDSVECGDDGLATVLDSFCERWGWGVRTLMQEANGFSQRLGLTAGLYYEQEQYLSDTLKQTVNAAMGDPAKSAEKLHNTSWGDVLADNPISQVKNADFDPTSAASLEAQQKARNAGNQFLQDVRSIPDRITHPFDGPAEATTEFHEPTKPEGHGGTGNGGNGQGRNGHGGNDK